MTQKIFVYALSPIDDWAGWVRPDDVVTDRAIGDVEPDKIRRSVLVGMLWSAQELAATIGWEGDFTVGPLVAGLPLADPSEFNFLIGWKQANNGTTFVASPIPLPHLEDGFSRKAEGVVA